MSDTLMDDPIVIDPEEIRDAAKRLLTDHVDQRAPYAEPPQDIAASLFDKMNELGWPLLCVPERMDGLGQSFAALAPIYEEMGRVTSPVALFPALASLEVLTLDAAGEKAHELAVGVATGECQVAVAIDRANAVTIDGGRLSGVLRSVPADQGVSHILVLQAQDGPGAVLVDLSATGVTVERPEMWDRSRPVIDVTLSDAQGTVLSGIPADALNRVRGHIDLALAWDSLGGARRSLDETVAYMLTRQQFGRPIGSFQALKHRAADHKVAIEVAAALLRDATQAFVENVPGATERAGQARLLANDAYHAMAEDSVQLHGGIGFTWEHDCHVFLKRALLNEMLFGTPDERRDALAPAIVARALEGRN